MSEKIRDAVLDKIHEQLDSADQLLRLLPPDCLDWAPEIPSGLAVWWPVGILLGHLLDCTAGFCAVLIACEPERLSHFAKLKELPVNHRCGPAEATERLAGYRAHIDQGFALLSDASLAQPVPTVFVEQGEPVITLLLGNLEHLINHKHQLFTYLKLLGIDAGTRDLYRFRA